MKKNVSRNLYDIYLTFSMELSPSHDFNSDKSIKYISVECILKYHKSNQDKPLNTY